MKRVCFLLFAGAILATGCSQTPPASDQRPGVPQALTNPTPQAAPAERDVTIEGISILGTWLAVQVINDAEATRDLQAGTMEMTLIVLPNGRSTLTGVDRREGTGRVSFSGIIEGNRISFDGMEGRGTLSMSGRRLVLLDPRGRSTIYQQAQGN